MRAKPTIRNAQKALTRHRITEAARHLFYEHGYSATSVDRIAVEAGASRPTFYLHFRDKDEVLAQIAEDYAAGVREYAESFPSPDPTREALRTWLIGLAAFLEREKAGFSLVSDLSANQVTPPAHGRLIQDAWKQALASRAPAFAAGMRKDRRSAEARAACELMIVEITWAASTAWLKKDAAFVDGALSMVSERLHDFLRDPRFLEAEPVGD
jgi:AcrR family transcriptional regulator